MCSAEQARQEAPFGERAYPSFGATLVMNATGASLPTVESSPPREALRAVCHHSAQEAEQAVRLVVAAIPGMWVTANTMSATGAS